MRSMKNKKGYKKTKLGWIPEEWEVVEVGKVTNVLTGFAFKSKDYRESGIKLLRGDNITPEGLRWTNVKFWEKVSEEEFSKYQLQIGDIVIAMDRTLISAGIKTSIISESDLPCLLVQRVARLQVTSALEQRLLKFYIKSSRFEKYVESVQKESLVPHISKQQVKQFRIPLPPLLEQQKIATILSTWDKAIDNMTALIAAKEEQKKGLMQRLLSSKNVSIRATTP